MDPIRQGFNKTTTFLLPILFPTNSHEELFSNYFKQAYIGLMEDEIQDAYGPQVVLKLDEENTTPDVIDDFISNFGSEGDVIHSYDNIIVYTFPESKIEDYNNFVNGAYSKISEESRLDILDFWDEGLDSLLSAILTNNKERAKELAEYIDRELVHQLKDVEDEAWPQPNVLMEELLIN